MGKGKLGKLRVILNKIDHGTEYSWDNIHIKSNPHKLVAYFIENLKILHKICASMALVCINYDSAKYSLFFSESIKIIL